MDRHLSRRSFLARTGLYAGGAVLGASVLASCETSSESPGPSGPPGKPAAPFPMIADTATRLNAATAAGLRALGIATVFRYYSHLPPSLPDKFVTPEEARIIYDAGLSLGTVFQHYNNCFRTFENAWGREDAEQALRQAEGIGQPAGSAIYFGVDGDWPYASMLGPVRRYFEDVNAAFAGSGYAVGVYSNGCVCDTIREAGLASYFWLSGSTAHTGTQAFFNLGRWTLYQNALDIGVGLPTVHIDTNLSNPAAGGYFGQFDARGARTAAHASGATSAIFNGRRFLAAAAAVRAGPDAGASELGALRQLSNVRVLGTTGGWSQVLTQEGGARRVAGGDAVTGYLPNDVLAPMDKFPGGVTAYGLCGASSEPSEAYKYEACARASDRLR